MRLELRSGQPLFHKVWDRFAGVTYNAGASKWDRGDGWPHVVATVEVEGVKVEFRLIEIHESTYGPDGITIVTEWYPVQDWPFR